MVSVNGAVGRLLPEGTRPGPEDRIRQMASVCASGWYAPWPSAALAVACSGGGTQDPEELLGGHTPGPAATLGTIRDHGPRRTEARAAAIERGAVLLEPTRSLTGLRTAGRRTSISTLCRTPRSFPAGLPGTAYLPSIAPSSSSPARRAGVHAGERARDSSGYRREGKGLPPCDAHPPRDRERCPRRHSGCGHLLPALQHCAGLRSEGRRVACSISALRETSERAILSCGTGRPSLGGSRSRERR